MILKEIRVGIARTINLGNYESIRIEAGLTVAVAEDDDLDAAHAALQADLRKLAEETYRAQHKPKPVPQPATPAEQPTLAPLSGKEW